MITAYGFAEHLLNDMSMIMECGARSFYTDMKYDMKYFVYITEELPKIVSEFLKVSNKKEDTYIAGFSMGGYGALKAALKRPEVFCVAAGLLTVADIKNNMFGGTLMPVFGEDLNIPDEED